MPDSKKDMMLDCCTALGQARSYVEKLVSLNVITNESGEKWKLEHDRLLKVIKQHIKDNERELMMLDTLQYLDSYNDRFESMRCETDDPEKQLNWIVEESAIQNQMIRDAIAKAKERTAQ